MDESRITAIERANDNPDEGATDMADLIDAYRALRDENAALKLAVTRALMNVGGLAGECPELAKAVGWEGGNHDQF
jgi:hypothetical protein